MAHFHIICPAGLWKTEIFNKCLTLLKSAGHSYYAYDYTEQYKHDSIPNADAVLFISNNWLAEIGSPSIKIEVERAHKLNKPIFISYKRTVDHGNGLYGIYSGTYSTLCSSIQGKSCTSEEYKKVKSKSPEAKTSSIANVSSPKEDKSLKSVSKEHVDYNHYNTEALKAEEKLKNDLYSNWQPKLIFIQLRDKRLLFRR